MRKISATFFLTVILLAQSPVQQLLKLPVLLAHFDEHKILHGDISFLQFIDLHYFGDPPKDGDYDRDQQLPFRTSEVIMISSTVVVPEQIVPNFEPLVFNQNAYPLFHASGHTAQFTFDIWQPPRAC